MSDAQAVFAWDEERSLTLSSLLNLKAHDHTDIHIVTDDGTEVPVKSAIYGTPPGESTARLILYTQLPTIQNRPKPEAPVETQPARSAEYGWIVIGANMTDAAEYVNDRLNVSDRQGDYLRLVYSAIGLQKLLETKEYAHVDKLSVRWTKAARDKAEENLVWGAGIAGVVKMLQDERPILFEKELSTNETPTPKKRYFIIGTDFKDCKTYRESAARIHIDQSVGRVTYVWDTDHFDDIVMNLTTEEKKLVASFWTDKAQATSTDRENWHSRMIQLAREAQLSDIIAPPAKLGEMPQNGVHVVIGSSYQETSEYSRTYWPLSRRAEWGLRVDQVWAEESLVNMVRDLSDVDVSVHWTESVRDMEGTGPHYDWVRRLHEIAEGFSK